MPDFFFYLIYIVFGVYSNEPINFMAEINRCNVYGIFIYCLSTQGKTAF